MKVVTLLENTACREDLAREHGLSMYIETPKHKILLDMGPDDQYLDNAKKLGVDLTQVDVAALSHGHFDHGQGLRSFRALNPGADIYVRESAFGEYYCIAPEKEPEYIGLDPTLDPGKFILTGEETVIDDELTLFSNVPDEVGALAASAMLREKTPEGFRTDLFSHEQDLLVTAEGKAVVFASCAHRGIVNIVRSAERRLGRRPDVTFGGFHMFQLTRGDPAADRLIDETARALLPGHTIYYTGHCTGAYAYERLHSILGDRLRPMSGGMTAEI